MGNFFRSVLLREAAGTFEERAVHTGLQIVRNLHSQCTPVAERTGDIISGQEFRMPERASRNLKIDGKHWQAASDKLAAHLFRFVTQVRTGITE